MMTLEHKIFFFQYIDFNYVIWLDFSELSESVIRW